MERMTRDAEIIKIIEDGRLDELDQLCCADKFDVNVELLGNHWTPLLHACNASQYNVVDMLLANGADVNQNVNGITPLMLACSTTTDPLKLVQLLLHKQALVNVSDSMGQTPLMFACLHGHLSVVRVLLPLASVDAVDNEGNTVGTFFLLLNCPKKRD